MEMTSKQIYKWWWDHLRKNKLEEGESIHHFQD